MLNMAPGDQKVIYEWGDGAGIKVDNDYDYQVNNIYQQFSPFKIIKIKKCL